jgi:hypothetical protein
MTTTQSKVYEALVPSQTWTLLEATEQAHQYLVGLDLVVRNNQESGKARYVFGMSTDLGAAYLAAIVPERGPKPSSLDACAESMLKHYPEFTFTKPREISIDGRFEAPDKVAAFEGDNYSGIHTGVGNMLDRALIYDFERLPTRDELQRFVLATGRDKPLEYRHGLFVYRHVPLVLAEELPVAGNTIIGTTVPHEIAENPTVH